MPGTLIVRPVAPADRAQWAPLWEGYNRFYERTLPAAITEIGRASCRERVSFLV